MEVNSAPYNLLFSAITLSTVHLQYPVALAIFFSIFITLDTFYSHSQSSWIYYTLSSLQY